MRRNFWICGSSSITRILCMFSSLGGQCLVINGQAERQAMPEARWRGFDLRIATVHSENTAADAQAQTGPFLIAVALAESIELVEHAFPFRRRQPGTLVTDAHVQGVGKW